MTDRLLRLTRGLVLAHLVLAVAAAALAAVCLVGYARESADPDVDPLIGFLVLYAIGLLGFAAVALPLAVVWLRTHAYGVALSLGLWTLLVAVLPAPVMLGAEPWWALVGLVSLALPGALAACGFWGLVRTAPAPVGS